MRRALTRVLALPLLLLLGACEAELNHAMTYDDVRRNPSAQAAAQPVPQPVAVRPPAAIATPPGAIAPPVTVTAAPVTPVPPPAPVATVPVPVAQTPGSEFCRASAAGEAGAGGFDEATRRGVYARSLAQCMALHGN